MSTSNPAKRAAALVGGGVVLLAGIALLVLPGPGLLLVLGGLLILANQFPSVEKYVEPVRSRAMKAAEESVSSPLRIAGSVLAGLLLIGAGVVWGLNKQLWLGGWPTGSSLILSGVVLLVLLGFSYRRVREGKATSQTSQPEDNDLTRS
jgi:Putative transmembrane protein (PGPGW)